jgi:hypothetical protein
MRSMNLSSTALSNTYLKFSSESYRGLLDVCVRHGFFSNLVEKELVRRLEFGSESLIHDVDEP